ncbi:uncharacterized [Tachysurus ichikawai]
MRKRAKAHRLQSGVEQCCSTVNTRHQILIANRITTSRLPALRLTRSTLTLAEHSSDHKLQFAGLFCTRRSASHRVTCNK